MNPQIERVPIDSVLQDPENARLHSAEQLKYIAASLKRFSQQKPIVVGKDNVIIAGNGTHQAAKEVLNWKDILIVRSELSYEDARAYGIADNQIPMQAEWDMDSLTKHLKDMAEWNPMQDWNAIGFEDDIVDPINEAEDEHDNTLRDFLDGESFKKKDKEDKAIMAKPIKVTQEQWEVIDQAITIVKMQTEDLNMSPGRALELMSADWLSGNHTYIQEEKDE
jgi:hypothetical protein